jgi:hypothetical protein
MCTPVSKWLNEARVPFLLKNKELQEVISSWIDYDFRQSDER